jgi:hypothetical protein
LHRVQSGRTHNGKFVQKVLELSVAREAKSAGDAHGSRRIGAQPLGHIPHAEQNKLPRIFQRGPDDFAPTGAELGYAIRQAYRRPHFQKVCSIIAHCSVVVSSDCEATFFT